MMCDHVALSELINVQNGYAFKSSDYKDTGHFLMRIGNVQDGTISFSRPIYVELDEKTKRFELCAGDCLISLTGNIGRVAVVEEKHLPAALNQRVARINVVDDVRVSERFLFLFLNSFAFRKSLSKAGHGAAQQNVSIKEISSIQIPIPPLLEQQRIVAILDEAFEWIGAADANAEKNLGNARELFESHLNIVFTQVGEGWMDTTIGEQVELLTGFAFKSKEYTDAPDAVTLVRGDNILQGYFRWNAVKKWPSDRVAEFEKFLLSENDIVLAMDRTWVKAGVKFAKITNDDLPCLLLQRVARLRAEKQLHEDFLYYLIGSKLFTEYVLSIQTGIGVPHISGKQIQAFRFSLPNIKQQREVVERLNELSSNVQRLEAIYQQKLDALGELKQSILAKAFSGELTARDIAA